MPSAIQIHPIKMTLSNAYLVIGERPILVDTGAPGNEQAILKAIQARGSTPRDIALILHTHGHGDHAGSTAALQAITGAPAAVHPLDAPLLQTGHRAQLHTNRLSARLLKPFVNKPFAPVEPDLLVNTDFSLADYGVNGTIMHTPGHTTGSISLLFDDGQAIIGDVLMGGHMGGTFQPSKPRTHYFTDDPAALDASLRLLLATDAHTFYVGHGGPLAREAILKRFAMNPATLSVSLAR